MYVHNIGSMTHGPRPDHYWAQLTRRGCFRALEPPRDEGAIAHPRSRAAMCNYGPDAPDIVARVARIEAVAAAHGVPLAAAALQFPLAHPAVASVIPGLGDARRVAQTLELYRVPIPAAFWANGTSPRRTVT